MATAAAAAATVSEPGPEVSGTDRLLADGVALRLSAVAVSTPVPCPSSACGVSGDAVDSVQGYLDALLELLDWVPPDLLPRRETVSGIRRRRRGQR